MRAKTLRQHIFLCIQGVSKKEDLEFSTLYSKYLRIQTSLINAFILKIMLYRHSIDILFIQPYPSVKWFDSMQQNGNISFVSF